LKEICIKLYWGLIQFVSTIIPTNLLFCLIEIYTIRTNIRRNGFVIFPNTI